MVQALTVHWVDLRGGEFVSAVDVLAAGMGWSDNILMRWFSGAFFVLDGVYGVCFWYTRRAEQRERAKMA